MRRSCAGLVEALYRIMNETPFAEKLQKADLPRSRAGIEDFVTASDDGLLKNSRCAEAGGPNAGALRRGGGASYYRHRDRPRRELFNEKCRAEAKRFIGILSKTLAAKAGVLALLTMRTDSFPQVQNDAVLAGVPKEIFTLDKMLEGSYREVIGGPAALVQPKPLQIDSPAHRSPVKGRGGAGRVGVARVHFALPLRQVPGQRCVEP